VTDEELIEGISLFSLQPSCDYDLLAGVKQGSSSMEMVTIDPLDLKAALERDSVP
jgi:hypothetical protein